jgi:hypothetical protein
MIADDFDAGVAPRQAIVAKRRKATGAPPDGIADTASLMDALSLEQALKDVDIANARVLDLTQRLIAAQQQTIDLQRAMSRLETKLAEQLARYQNLRNSRAYRIANRYWRILAVLRGLE